MWQDEVEKELPLFEKLRRLRAALGPLQAFMLRTVTTVEKIEAIVSWHDPWVRVCVCACVRE